MSRNETGKRWALRFIILIWSFVTNSTVIFQQVFFLSLFELSRVVFGDKKYRFSVCFQLGIGAERLYTYQLRDKSRFWFWSFIHQSFLSFMLLWLGEEWHASRIQLTTFSQNCQRQQFEPNNNNNNESAKPFAEENNSIDRCWNIKIADDNEDWWSVWGDARMCEEKQSQFLAKLFPFV